MNYFAHALPFLDRPYFAAGTGVPDWLPVVARRVRVRRKHVESHLEDGDPIVAEVAGGILQHIGDDARFHETRAFAELVLELTARVRDALDAESGFRPGFLGHLLVEVMLDASLAAENPGKIGEYYRALESVDPNAVEEAVNRMAPRRSDRLAGMISLFCGERILYDYLEDARLLKRLNQVMRRVQVAPLPRGFAELLPEARRMVQGRKNDLLEGIPT